MTNETYEYAKMDQEENYRREINMLKMNIYFIERDMINGYKTSIVLPLDKPTNLLARFEMAKNELTRKMIDDGENVDSTEERLSKTLLEVKAAIEIKNKMVDKLDKHDKQKRLSKLLNCLCIHLWINLDQFMKYSHK